MNRDQLSILYELQFKTLNLGRNGRKPKKPKASFVASPVQDLYGFYQQVYRCFEFWQADAQLRKRAVRTRV